MALKKCPECGKKISQEADPCPNCGKKNPFGLSDLRKIVIVAILFPMLFCFVMIIISSVVSQSGGGTDYEPTEIETESFDTDVNTQSFEEACTCVASTERPLDDSGWNMQKTACAMPKTRCDFGCECPHN